MCGLESFCKFRVEFGLPPIWPVPLQDLIYYIANMSKSGFSHSTVSCYLSGLSHYHKLNEFQDNTQRFIVKKLVDGLKRSTRKMDSRLPITRQILKQILGVLPCICSSQFEAVLFAAAFSLAFHGLFRVGELTIGAKLTNHTILWNNVQVKDNCIEIFMKTSKTDQFGKGYTLVIGEQLDVSVCPVRALRSYLDIRSFVSSGPLFCHFDGKPLSGYQFSAVLKKSLCILGFDTTNYKSHSFRIGMATTLSLEGFSDSQIMSMGRWKSDCFKKYIRL